MANLPGLSYNPYTGLPNTKKDTLPLGSLGAGLGASVGGPVASGSSSGTFGPPYTGTPGLVAVVPEQPSAFTLPDFTSLINNDPLYRQSLGDLGASHTANLAALTKGLQQAIIAYGQVPDQAALGQLGLPSGALAGLDAQTTALADQNTQNGLSTVARLNQAYTQGKSQLLRALAARGVLNSGESGYQLNQLQTQRNQAGYDATQSLLGLLGSEFGQYSGSEQQLTAQEQAAAEAAANRAAMQALLAALANLGSGGGGNGSASPAPSNPSATQGAYHGQTYTVPNPGFTPADVAAYRFNNPYNPNR